MIQKGFTDGMKATVSQDTRICKACIHGKATHASISKSRFSLSLNVLGIVHTNMCGKLSVPSLAGSLYFVSCSDDHPRCWWIYAINSRADMFSTFGKWLSMKERQIGRKQKALHSDNGGEYLSTEKKAFMIERVILQRLTVPQTLQQHGTTEKLDQLLLDLVRSMIYEKNQGREF